jgi:hypothetical protein
VMYDSPAVVDLKATASSPEQRLAKIAERVGMRAHPKAKALIDLAKPFSSLMQQIETGDYNDPVGAQNLFFPLGTDIENNAEIVIDQYSLATGRDLKSQLVTVSDRAKPAAQPTIQMSPPARALVRTNGQGVRPGAP